MKIIGFRLIEFYFGKVRTPQTQVYIELDYAEYLSADQ